MNRENAAERLANTRSDLEFVADQVANLLDTVDDAVAVIEDEEATLEELQEVLEDVAVRVHMEQASIANAIVTAREQAEAATV